MTGGKTPRPVASQLSQGALKSQTFCAARLAETSESPILEVFQASASEPNPTNSSSSISLPVSVHQRFPSSIALPMSVAEWCSPVSFVSVIALVSFVAYDVVRSNRRKGDDDFG